MILVIILSALFIAALASLIISRWSNILPRYIALFSVAFDIILLFLVWKNSSSVLSVSTSGWLSVCNMNWIPALGINIFLAMDGLSMIMIMLTLVMSFIAILASPETDREGYYYFNTLLMIAGVTGIFLAFDLFLFFFFWEMMLVPLYLLMLMLSKENGLKISFKFLLYTQTGGLLLLLSILSLSFIYTKSTGLSTYNYFELLNFSVGIKTALLLMPGFLIAFLVKLPVVPIHGWLGGSFISTPVTGIITGLLIKTGAYGLIRFAVPLFYEASQYFAIAAMILGVVTILYGAIMACSQNDLRLIAAYSSISHVGFILIGIYAFNEISWQGVVLQIITSAVSSGAIMLIAFSLLKRTGTCDITQMGGLWEKVPVFSGLGLFFAVASLGLPGTGNFLAEFLILLGVFKVNIPVAVISSFGLIASAIYSLRIIQKIFVGKKTVDWQIPDFSNIEKVTVGFLLLLTLWLGFFPQPVLDKSKSTIEKILNMRYPENDLPLKNDKYNASVVFEKN